MEIDAVNIDETRKDIGKSVETATGYKLPLVSVVVPFYNDQEHIDECLESCVSNTYPNIEIIIVDDCSKEPFSIEKLKVDLKNRLVTVIRNFENKGSGYARNVGIKKAKGELIAFLDSDDIWMKDIVEKQVNEFLSGDNVNWVYTNGYYLIDDRVVKKPNSGYHFKRGQSFPVGKEVNDYHLLGYNYMTFSANMFRKDVLFDIGLFNEELEVSEDWDLFVRAAEKYEVNAIDEPLMFYRVNNSGRHFVNREYYVETNIEILKGMYERQNLLPERIKDFNYGVAMIY